MSGIRCAGAAAKKCTEAKLKIVALICAGAATVQLHEHLNDSVSKVYKMVTEHTIDKAVEALKDRAFVVDVADNGGYPKCGWDVASDEMLECANALQRIEDQIKAEQIEWIGSHMLHNFAIGGSGFVYPVGGVVLSEWELPLYVMNGGFAVEITKVGDDLYKIVPIEVTAGDDKVKIDEQHNCFNAAMASSPQGLSRGQVMDLLWYMDWMEFVEDSDSYGWDEHESFSDLDN